VIHRVGIDQIYQSNVVLIHGLSTTWNIVVTYAGHTNQLFVLDPNFFSPMIVKPAFGVLMIPDVENYRSLLFAV
jgi:hypothetical protein